ncbi:MAG TPA: hydrogenase assembly protein HupF, partial [Mycobacteriales bacterium]|nr:hydrogenase assembly protein HupF [Mycobacteriales bacterium]
SLPGSALTANARANVRAGDVLVAVGAADDDALRDLARRAPAWGLAVVWIGAGAPPPSGSADALLWFDDEMAAHDGRFMLVYHLLWELAHVCLEHGGVLRSPADCDGPVCVTCADEGRLAEVLAVDGVTARVRAADGEEDVDLALVGVASVHDLLVVHAGTAIARFGGAP